MDRISDFRSDTVTRPTEEMRKAMMTVEVGDDVFGDDPTVNRLESLAAEMLKKEEALFVPSGTMGNQIALRVLSDPGDEIILSDTSHIIQHEVGAAARLAGLQTRTLKTIRGRMDPDEVKKCIRGEDIHFPKTALICLENPHNDDGGVAVSPEYMKEIKAIAESEGLHVHLDGARIFNAALHLKLSAAELASYADTVMICLSKGLCSPVGSLLLGTKEHMKKARKIRKMLGGGMRQAGILAICGIIGLTKMIERLKEDHERASAFADFLSDIPGISLDRESVNTNMVYFHIKDNMRVIRTLEEQGILVIPHGDRVRVTFHNDVGDGDLERLKKAITDYTGKLL